MCVCVCVCQRLLKVFDVRRLLMLEYRTLIPVEHCLIWAALHCLNNLLTFRVAQRRAPEEQKS